MGRVLNKSENIPKRENPILDLAQLREDYQQGYSALGHPSRGYYITSWRGMESLQTYCTKELVQIWGDETQEERLREVQVKNNGKQYAMKSWTYEGFEDHLVDALRNEGVPIKSTFRGTVDREDLYTAIINTAFNGELDRTAFIKGSMSALSHSMRSSITNTMQVDILRAKDGHSDDRAKAAAFAYEKGLSPTVRLVDFDGDAVGQDDLMGYRHLELDVDDWLAIGGEMYLEQLTDSSTTDTVTLESAKARVREIRSVTDRQLHQRAGDWNRLVDYMQKNVMFFLDEKPSTELGAGLRNLDAIHNAVGLDKQVDMQSFRDSIVNLGYGGGFEAPEPDDGLEF